MFQFNIYSCYRTDCGIASFLGACERISAKADVWCVSDAHLHYYDFCGRNLPMEFSFAEFLLPNGYWLKKEIISEYVWAY